MKTFFQIINSFKLQNLEAQIQFKDQKPTISVKIEDTGIKDGIHLENIEITYPGRATKGMAYIPLNRLNQVPEQIDKYPEFSMFGELPSWGFYIRHAKNIKMKNVKLKLTEPDYRPAIIMDDVKGESLEQLFFPLDKREQIIIVNN